MNLASIIDGHVSSRVALVDGVARVTYGELRENVATIAASLLGSGAEPGQNVGIVAPNGAGFVAAYLGVLHAGMVAVPLNPHSPQRELDSELARVGADIVLDGTELHRTRADRSAMGQPAEAAAMFADDPAALLFTSGTAGPPRPAVLTHGNLLSNIGQVQRHPGGLADQPRVALAVVPLHHIFGLNAVLGVALAIGGTLVMHDGLDPERVARDLVTHQIDVVAGTPSLWAGLLESGVAGHDTVARVRFATSGAAHLPGSVADRALEDLGLVLRQGYGLTEASPVVSSAVGTAAPWSSVGRPLPGVEVRLVDDGADALVDDEGEIWVRGPNVFAGYWNDPDATSSVVTADGWLRTGDIGVVDSHGHLHLVDRAKDLIIVSGFNVHPTEVEDVLAEHPLVADAGVVGEPDVRTGETVVAHVVVRDAAVVTAEELRSFCRERLARYKCPTRIEIVPAIPRGGSGKVLRRELGGGRV